MMTLHKAFVLLSGYLVYGLSIGLFYALGALFTVIMDTFNASRAETSVIQSIYGACLLGGGIIYGRITSRFGALKGTVVGSLLTSGGLIVSFWATSLPYLIATSAVTACGCGLCFVTCTVGIRQQFPGRSGVMALALVSSSSGTMGVVLTYLLRYLSSMYGLRGTLLIMGGLQLNGVGLCWLWKPPTNKRNLRKGTPREQTNVSNYKHTNERCSVSLVDGDHSNVTEPKHDRGTFSTPIPEEMTYAGLVNEGYTNGTDNTGAMVTDNPMSGDLRQVTLVTGDSSTDQPKHGGPTANTSLPTSTHSELSAPGTHALTVKDKVKYIFGLPSYICTLFGMIMCLTCAQMYVVFIVDMFVDAGLTETEGSAAIAIINIAAILGRVSPALLVRCPFYSPFVVPITAGALCTLTMALFTMATNVYLLSCLTGMLGFAIGVYVSIVVVNISELVGQEYLAEAVGLMMTPAGLFVLIVGPFTGFLRDSSGSYAISHIIAALFTGFGTVLFICASFFHSRQQTVAKRKLSSVFYVTKL